MPTTETSVRPCRSRSQYGECGRTGKHGGPHAVPIGEDVWFGYERGGVALGYGHLHGDAFEVGPLSVFAEGTDHAG